MVLHFAASIEKPHFAKPQPSLLRLLSWLAPGLSTAAVWPSSPRTTRACWISPQPLSSRVLCAKSLFAASLMEAPTRATTATGSLDGLCTSWSKCMCMCIAIAPARWGSLDFNKTSRKNTNEPKKPATTHAHTTDYCQLLCHASLLYTATR